MHKKAPRVWANNMKKYIFILLVALFGISLNLHAEQIPIKKNGKQVGNLEYSYSEGNKIEKSGWGQEVIVVLYNDSNEYVNATVYLKGTSDSSPKFVTLKPYQQCEISLWTEGNYRGVAVENVYTD